MKKGLLILLGMFMMVSTVEAKKGEKVPSSVGANYNDNNAIRVFERGIEFHVFLNGDFDFDTRRNTIYYDDTGRRNRTNSVRVLRDFRGRITTVGTTRISYDFRGNVRRIGPVLMNYRFGNLTRVGGLHISYNQWGAAYFKGQVRRTNFYTDSFGLSFNLNSAAICAYNDPYFFKNDFRNKYSQIREDNNFYYYKAHRNAKIGQRNTLLKRRKSATKTPTKRTVRKRIHNTYNRNSKLKKEGITKRNAVRKTASERTKTKNKRSKKLNVGSNKKITRNLKNETSRKRRN
jgi:hypothetical protein